MIEAYLPRPDELWFRRKMLADEATMAYNRAYGDLVKSGEIAKFMLTHPGGVRGWFTRLCYQGETDDKVTE